MKPLRTAQPADSPSGAVMTLTNAPEALPPGTGDRPAVHPVAEVLPAPRLFVLGLQHLFIMYAGAVAVPLIVGGAVKLPIPWIGLLVNADLFVSGIATIIQSVGIGKIFGVRLPVVAGATFTVLSPMIIIAQQYGLAAVYGAMLCSGVFGLLIAKPFSMMVRFFPPLVAGTVICVIGLSLTGADVSLIAGDDPTSKSFGQISHLRRARGRGPHLEDLRPELPHRPVRPGDADDRCHHQAGQGDVGDLAEGLR